MTSDHSDCPPFQVSRRRGFALALGVLVVPSAVLAAQPPVVVPAATLDEPAGAGVENQTIVLAGGCFWGVQAVYQHTKGVVRAVSGYAGDSKDKADYELVSRGMTRHAEVVAVTFDSRAISLGTILQIFFSVVHDPTEIDRQGPDVGAHYRSAVFATDERQSRHVAAYIDQLNKARVYGKPIATRLEAASPFYPAEAYHQDYATLHPNQPYIVIHDRPKIENLRRLFPAQYRDVPVLVGAAPSRK